jgi:hypothetical protein
MNAGQPSSALVDAHFLVESRNASFTRASDRA